MNATRLAWLLSAGLAASIVASASAQTIDWQDEGRHHFQRADCQPLHMAPGTMRCERRLAGATFVTWMSADGFSTATAEAPNTPEGEAEILDYLEALAPWREPGAPESFDRRALRRLIADELSDRPSLGVGCLAWLITKSPDALSFQIDRRPEWQDQLGPAPDACWRRPLRR